MTIRLLAVAEAEFDDAVKWYGGKAPELAVAFFTESLKVFRLIEQHPDAWQEIAPAIRRCRMTRFPYGMIYAIDGRDIVVLAIAHLHRAPLYWRNRLPST